MKKKPQTTLINDGVTGIYNFLSDKNIIVGTEKGWSNFNASTLKFNNFLGQTSISGYPKNITKIIQVDDNLFISTYTDGRGSEDDPYGGIFMISKSDYENNNYDSLITPITPYVTPGSGDNNEYNAIYDIEYDKTTKRMYYITASILGYFTVTSDLKPGDKINLINHSLANETKKIAIHNNHLFLYNDDTSGLFVSTETVDKYTDDNFKYIQFTSYNSGIVSGVGDVYFANNKIYALVGDEIAMKNYIIVADDNSGENNLKFTQIGPSLNYYLYNFFIIDNHVFIGCNHSTILKLNNKFNVVKTMVFGVDKGDLLDNAVTSMILVGNNVYIGSDGPGMFQINKAGLI